MLLTVKRIFLDNIICFLDSIIDFSVPLGNELQSIILDVKQIPDKYYQIFYRKKFYFQHYRTIFFELHYISILSFLVSYWVRFAARYLFCTTLIHVISSIQSKSEPNFFVPLQKCSKSQ